MTTSVFTELLSSYSGLRKRTWTPSTLNEAFDPTPEQQAAVGEIEATFKAALSGQLQYSKGKKKNISMVLKDGKVTISGSNVGNKSLDNAGWQNEWPKLSHSGSWARKLLNAWAPAEEEDKAPAGEGDKAPTQPDLINRDGTGVIGSAEGGVQFSPEQRKLIEKFFVDARGMSEGASKETVEKLEKTVNTPLARTRIGRALASIMGGARREMANKAKQQALLCVVSLVTALEKVETVKLADWKTSGSLHRIIPEGKLTMEERQALRITTIRGSTGTKGVFFGRLNADAELFDALQELALEDHNTYGTTFGTGLNESLEGLRGVRLLPSGVLPETISDDEALKVYPMAVGKSKSSGKNDRDGKLTEDIVEIKIALLAGDKEQQREALKHLHLRLMDAHTLSTANTEYLEAALLSDEFDQIEYFKRLQSLGVGPEDEIRAAMTEAAMQTELFFELAGIPKDGVLGVCRPSQASEMGYKSDVDIILTPEAVEKMNDPFKSAVYKDANGNYKLSLSVKNYKALDGDTVIGSSSLNKAYASIPTAGKATTAQIALAQRYRLTSDRLHSSFLDRAVKSEAMTADDAQSCVQAVETDRVMRENIEAKIGNLSDPNRADLTAYLSELERYPPSHAAGTSVADGRKADAAYKAELKSIKAKLKEKGQSGARFAALKLWQFQRMQRAQRDPEYARAAAYNDFVFSAGTFDDEVMFRGSPGNLTLSTNHGIYDGVAQRLFAGNGTASLTASSSQIHDADGNTISDTRVTAKKTGNGGRKLQGEAKLPTEGRKAFATTTPLTRKPDLEDWDSKETSETPPPPLKKKSSKKKSSKRKVSNKKKSVGESVEGTMGEDPESQEEESFTGSPFSRILQKLPPMEVGDPQQVGDKLITTLFPFCLKVKHEGEEFEGGFPGKSKALKALALIRLIAKEQGETIDAKVVDYDAGRVFS